MFVYEELLALGLGAGFGAIAEEITAAREANDMRRLAEQAKKLPCPTKTYRGGPHSMTKGPVGDGLDSHHMPPRSVMDIDPEIGPAIQMEPVDHRLTSSHGSQGLAGAEYRSEIKELIKEGRMGEAMAREIEDVRRAALEGSGNAAKYDDAIAEMLDYAKRQGWLK